jgi:hypothetical protein
MTTVLGIIVLLVVVVFILAAMKPAVFRVVRSAVMRAPADKVFGLINDFHAWERWSPWARLDPAMQSTYSGSTSGKGAIYEWVSSRRPRRR